MHASAFDDLKALRLDAPADQPPPSIEEARRYVRTLTTGHYENFSVLSRLVPDSLRPDFASIYAFCRWSDDLADETGHDANARARSTALLAQWRAMLQNCIEYSRATSASASTPAPAPPTHPVFIALAETMRRHELPGEPFHHLLDAFEQDQRITRYETWEQLIQYCTRSADPVGRLILMLDGRRLDNSAHDHLFRMSDATCTALQLINFWQDVRRDLLERDRIYLPIAETHFTPERLHDWAQRPDDPAARVPFINALRPLVERTRLLFIEGRPLPSAMRSTLSPVVWLFGRGGEAVLRRVERLGCATLWTRPRLSKASKVMLVARASILSATGTFRR